LKGVSVGFLAATYHITEAIDAELAKQFFYEAVSGDGELTNAALLRETVGDILEKKLDDKRLYISSAFRQAWTATRAGKTLDSIRLTLNMVAFK
jgi:hypothetical protein